MLAVGLIAVVVAAFVIGGLIAVAWLPARPSMTLGFSAVVLAAGTVFLIGSGTHRGLDIVCDLVSH